MPSCSDRPLQLINNMYSGWLCTAERNRSEFEGWKFCINALLAIYPLTSSSASEIPQQL
jgi:hypothetical protein